MKLLTARQKTVLARVERYTVPSTVAEIAADLRMSTSTVRAALKVLEAHGCVEVRGSAMSGGVTWGVPR